MSVSVILASEGYPASYPKGRAIDITQAPNDVVVFHAGTALSQDKNTLLTAGGRVLAVSAYGETLIEALETVYRGVEAIQFQGKTYRKDIAHR